MSDRTKPRRGRCIECGKPSPVYSTCWVCWGQGNDVDPDTIASWEAPDADDRGDRRDRDA